MKQSIHKVVVTNKETSEIVHEESTNKMYDSFIKACHISDRLEKTYPKDLFDIKVVEV